MRLFLSSSCVAGEVAQLTELVGAGARVAVTANALDDEPELRRHWLEVEMTALERAGLEPVELDLRIASLSDRLADIEIVWGTGGNVFALREAMRESGLDVLLRERLAEDSLAYGGCSAGACVCAPTLRGFELIEAQRDGVQPRWDGLALIAFSIVPHAGADASGEAMESLASYFEERAMPYRMLRDGQAIVIRGEQLTTIEV